jgi:hypothetical protein
MKISILIAARQNGPQIAGALASIQAQLHSDWELVVIEYDSADETRAIIDAFRDTAQRPVHYLNLGENHGAASARNRLLELATADFVAFLDPGDRWLPLHLTNAMAGLAGHADVVASDVRLFDPATGRQLGALSIRPKLSLNPARALFVRDALAVPSSIAFRRDLSTRVGLFDPRFLVAETRDFLLRCALAGARFAATQGATCLSATLPGPDPQRALLLATQTVQFYEKHRDASAVPATLRRRLLAASLVAQGRLLRIVDPAAAARCFWRAWSLQPVSIQTLGQFALTGWRSTPGTQPVAGTGKASSSRSSASPFAARSSHRHGAA